MSTGTKRALADALRDAEAFRELFAGTYSKWVIAGSVRRQKPMVSDVEHVIVPLVGEVQVGDSLFPQTATANLFIDRSDKLVEQGVITKHVYDVKNKGSQNRWGEKYRGCDFRGFNHEVFSAAADNFGNILLIRTGSEDFSHGFVDRILRGRLYRQQDGYLVHVRSGDKVPIHDEEAFFRMAGIPFVPPEGR